MGKRIVLLPRSQEVIDRNGSTHANGLKHYSELRVPRPNHWPIKMHNNKQDLGLKKRERQKTQKYKETAKKKEKNHNTEA